MTNWTSTRLGACLRVCSGGWRGIQQSGGRTGGDHVLVGRVGQVDSLHSHMWRGSDDTGETLPQTEVSPSDFKISSWFSAHAVTSLIRYSSKCLSFASRKKVVAGKDNMTCTGTAKKYHLCNSKVSHGLPVNLSSLCVTSLLKQTPSLRLLC